MAAESELQEFFTKLTGTTVCIYNAAMRGGEIQAFFRQGIGELGNALVAFPPGPLHHEEPGAIFSPIYKDIDDSRKAYMPSPAALAEGTGQQQQDQGPQQKPGTGISM